ncbi:nucleolar pre-ribosomal-associated protein 1 [Amyelois transitella]|uniref:nucleolar pre-ribosomal-associated protein 1 n=1 Tax=Amyelois transitella TaxID=680683 RepID=UPI00067D004D|nr:nucleolar pre-ribosomal-associated protein 1 [Amyelois transitella]
MGKRKYEENTRENENKPEENESETHLLKPETDRLDDAISTQKKKKIGGFDVKHFRKELAAKQGQTMVLTQFLQVCLNPDNEVDYLLEYLKIGGNSHEILRQIGAENKKNLTLATPAFHLFHLIILKVQSSLPHMIAVTEEACRYFLNNFMSTVEIMISENSGPRHRKIVLKLLTSMVTLNSDLGIEVLNQAPLTPKHLQYITEKPNYKEKDNVRTAFVHFMTSFLVEGHLPLIKALLEKQGLLALVVPGLVHDEAEAVLIFLNILKKNVVENPLISKSLKLKTFSQHVLHNMFKIFSWKGPPETSREVQNEFRPEITSLLSQIILTVFTSHKLGVYFTDNSLGTTDVHKNQNLYKALLSLKRPWENEKECEVILQIVDKCPDLHRAIINVIEQSFEPQHSPIWERTVDFTLKLLDILKPENFISRLVKLSVSQVSNFVRFITLPLPILKFVNRDLGKDCTVSLYCIKLLVKMLQTLRRYMQILGMQDTLAQITDLKSKLEYFFPKHMPAPAAVVALIKEVMKDKEDADNIQGYRLPKLDKTESLTCLVDLLLLYNEIQPAFFETLEDNINMKEILDFSMSLANGNTSLLKFKIVSLWLTLDDTGISVKNPMFKELFLIMLEVYTNEDDNTWIEAKDTLFNFFQNTTIFEADEDEIHLVLYLLRNSKVNPISLVADIIEYVLINIDQLTNVVRNNVIDFENKHKSNEGSLDKLLDDLTEGRNTDENVFLESKMPSPFVVGCVQYAQQNKIAKKSMKSFISLYIANLFHSNYSPEFSEVLLGDLKLDARIYVNSWLSNPVALSDSIIGGENTLNIISRSIINGENIPLKNILTFIDEVIEEESDLAVDGTYYKIVSNKNIDGSEMLMWAKYLIFCTVRLSDMGLLEEDRQKKITLYFQTLISVGKKRHMMNMCRTIFLALFKNPYVLKIYKPLDLKESKSALLPTKFLLDVIQEQKDIINYLDQKFKILKAYQQKNYSEILKTLSKINKRRNINSEHTMEVMNAVGLTKDDDLLVLNKIFSCEANCCVKDDKEPSIVLDVLQALLDKYSKSINTDLPQHVLRKAMKLYTELLINKDVTANLTNLEQTFIKYLENKPHEVAFVPEDIFKKFFYANAIRKSTSNLASILLTFNTKFCKVFKEEMTRPEIISQRELCLPLGNAVLNHNQLMMNKEFLPAIYNEYKSNINKLLEKPHKAGQVYLTNWKFIKKLILECMDFQDCQKVFGKAQKYEVVETRHLDLIQAVYMKLCLSDEGHKKEYFSNYLLSVLHIITTALKESRGDEVLAPIISSVNEVIRISKSIKGFDIEQKDDFKKVTESAVWQNFCKMVLKDSLKVKKADQSNNCGHKFLHLLSTLVKILYPSDHEDIVLLFDMVTSHSEFLNVMLSYHSSEIKTSLVEFLYTLTCTNKSVMKLTHVPVYLSSYHATRSPCDRLILAILHYYESNGQPVNEYKPYVFGDSAANYYAVRKNRSATLWSHPTPNRVLSLFDRDVIERTVRNFPVNQKLVYHYELPNENLTLTDSLMKITKEGIQKSVKDNEGAVKALIANLFYSETNSLITDEISNISHVDLGPDIYDPAFVFPLLSHLLAPGSVASCFKLLRTGLLSLPVAALSSLCPVMRAAAYHVLHRFSMLLETETRHKNDKLFLTDFVTTLRQSLSANASPDFNNPRLPAIDALYLARALMVSTSPADPLYKPVNNFFIAKQLVDLTTVPDFLSLFHDSDVEAAERRAWILDVIRDGTKTMTDVNVIFKTMCLKMIMDFYSSVLCDRRTKEKIIGVLSALVSIPRAFEILVEGYGLMSWIKSAVSIIRKDDKILVVKMIDFVKNMLHSLWINALTKNLSVAKNGKAIFELKISKDVEYELMRVLYDLQQYTNSLYDEELVAYVDVCLMLSKRTVKLLSKEQMLIFVSRTASSLESESVKLLAKAVVDNDSTVLCSNNLNGSQRDCLLGEMTSFVRNYLM